MKTRLLDWYAKGHVQKFVTWVTIILVFVVASALLEFICRGFLISDVDAALGQNVPPDQMTEIKRHLARFSGWFGFQLFSGIMFMALVGWFVMKLSTRLNLVGEVTLGKALRFTDAMERLGLIHELEQLHFVRHYKIPLYIAANPLLNDEVEAVKARLYPFVRTLLASTDFMAAEKGRKRLCVKAEDLEAALAQIGHPGPLSATDPVEETPASLRELQAQVANLEMEKKVLQSQFVEAAAKVQELEDTNSKLKAGLGNQARQEGKGDKAQKRLFLCALGLSPIFRAIVANKPDRRDVTREAVCSLFKINVNNDPVLKSLLLGIGESKPDELPDNISNLAWGFLKGLDLTNPSGPAPTGNLARLKKLIFIDE
jgi:hypothetical protein